MLRPRSLMHGLGYIAVIVLAPLLLSGCQPIGGSDPLDQTGRIYTVPNNQTEFHGEMALETSRSF